VIGYDAQRVVNKNTNMRSPKILPNTAEQLQRDYKKQCHYFYYEFNRKQMTCVVIKINVAIIQTK